MGTGNKVTTNNKILWYHTEQIWYLCVKELFSLAPPAGTGRRVNVHTIYRSIPCSDSPSRRQHVHLVKLYRVSSYNGRATLRGTGIHIGLITRKRKEVYNFLQKKNVYGMGEKEVFRIFSRVTEAIPLIFKLASLYTFSRNVLP
jgi:hypothetical protein